MTDFLNFQAQKIPELRQEGDTILDDLNRQIEFIKGKNILSYHIPSDINKEKEPLLNRKLQRIWLPAKSVAQKIQNH